MGAWGSKDVLWLLVSQCYVELCTRLGKNENAELTRNQLALNLGKCQRRVILRTVAHPSYPERGCWTGCRVLELVGEADVFGFSELRSNYGLP